MSRKSFNFNRSLNTNLSAVEDVFDDLTKTSKLKQQPIENKDTNNSISDIVSSIETDLSIDIKNNISTTSNSDTFGSIKTIIPSDTNSNMVDDKSSESNHLSYDKLTNKSSTPIANKVDTEEKITVRNLSKWHTEAEQKVYRVLYNQTIALDRNNWYFSFNELVKKTGFKSKITIAMAIDGLADKKSIDILTDKRGDHLGKRYKVYTPSQILLRREQYTINIDPQTKKII